MAKGSDLREIYPNAPLEFVACEVRFPHALALAEQSRLMKVQRALFEWLPLVEPAITAISIGSAGSAPVPFPGQMFGFSGSQSLRFLARDRQFGVVVTPESVSIETTRYTRYEEFRERIQQVLVALESVDAAIPGLTRIGLRYIDEIRVDKGVSRIGDWDKFVDARLVGPLDLQLGTTTPESLQGALQYALGGSKHVAMRFGSQKGRAVGDAPLRRRGPAKDGLYFLIDIDSFWTGEEPIPEFSAEVMLATCDELHRPVRQLFEAVITNRLRNEVLRNAKHRNSKRGN